MGPSHTSVSAHPLQLSLEDATTRDCQICVKMGQKTDQKWHIFSFLSCPESVSDRISSHIIFENFLGEHAPVPL